MNLLRTRILSATLTEKESSRKAVTKKLSLTKAFLQHIDLTEYKAIDGKEHQYYSRALLRLERTMNLLCH